MTANAATNDRVRWGTASRALAREIAIGGLAGLLAGLLVGGIGGRLVMRLAALLAPDSVGRFTENGNRIGDITVEGTLALVLFGGLAFGLFAASAWVVARPWLPHGPAARAAVSSVLGVGLFGFGLISASNPDFRILGFDPVIVGSLIVLVALGGPVLALVEVGLDRVLPPADAGASVTAGVYVALVALGALLTVLVTLPAFLGSAVPISGVAMAVAGLGTAIAWCERLELGVDPRIAAIAPWLGRGGLVVAAGAGLIHLGEGVALILRVGAEG